MEVKVNHGRIRKSCEWFRIIVPNLFEFYRNCQRTKWTYSGEKKDGKGGGRTCNKPTNMILYRLNTFPNIYTWSDFVRSHINQLQKKETWRFWETNHNYQSGHDFVRSHINQLQKSKLDDYEKLTIVKLTRHSPWQFSMAPPTSWSSKSGKRKKMSKHLNYCILLYCIIVVTASFLLMMNFTWILFLTDFSTIHSYMFIENYPWPSWCAFLAGHS